MAKLVSVPRHRWLGGLFCEKNEICGFWDVKVGIACKCPQMNTIKFLVYESFKFRGFCIWPSWSVHHGIGSGLVGCFVKKWNSWFLRCEGWNGLQISPNEYYKILGARKLSSVGFAHGQVGRCTTTFLDGLVGSFVKKWNSWLLRCEWWNDLQMSLNEYHESLGSLKFWVQWVLQMAKLVGAPRHR